jgi:putative ABC transport system permease protein
VTTRWTKVWRDVRVAEGRVLMIVAALAVSLAAVVTMLTTFAILRREVPQSYITSNPASAQLYLDTVVSDSLLAAVRAQPAIREADRGTTLSARLHLASGERIPMLLFVVPDLAASRIGTLHPEAGQWPAPDGAVMIERSALALTQSSIGGRIDVELPTGGKRSLAIAGTVHDPGVAPAWQEQMVYGYVSARTLTALGEPVSFTILKLVVRDQSAGQAAIDSTMRALAPSLAARGAHVLDARVPPPRRHPHQSQMNAVITMLLVFSLLGLVLGAVLTSAVINGLLAEQVRQIAIMKAIGARSRQIASLYLSLVACLGAVAVLTGLPLGLIAGRKLVAVVGELLNLRIESVALPWWVYFTAIALGIAAPLIAAAVPIRRASWRTVRDALDDHGTSASNESPGLISRALVRVRFRSPGLTLAFRNLFRRRGRLVMTASLLAGAGALFIASLDLKAAWERNVADAIRDRDFAVEIWLRDDVARSAVVSRVAAMRGVARVESWAGARASRTTAGELEVTGGYPDGGHGGFVLREAPTDTKAITHRMSTGRWLAAGDTDAVVINGLARSLVFQDVQLGDTILLRVNHKPVRLHVVGFIRQPLTPGSVFVTPITFARASQRGDSTNAVRVTFVPDVSVREATRRMVDALDSAGVAVSNAITESRMASAQGGHVYILVFALGVIALVMAIVAMIGLASSLGVSVLERTREFGVMRAIGCSRSDIMVTVLAEGLCIALLSAVAAVIVSRLVSTVVGAVLASIANQELVLRLSPTGVAVWITGLLLGAALVSWYPALRAARITVRDALTHV